MTTILQLREKIKKIDANIIQQLAQRQELCKQVGILKAKQGTAVTDQIRENNLMAFYEQQCEQAQLPVSFVKKLFNLIIAHSKQVQKNL
jgi:chorismate mutase